MFCNRLLLVTCFLLLSQISLLGNATTDVLEKAATAYQEKAYGQAIEAYESLVEEGYSNAALFYNLGNSYYRADRLGAAILNYEKALLLAPGDEEIQYNLTIANSRTTDQFEPLPSFFLARWWGGLQNVFSIATWTIIALLFVWLGVAGLIIWLLSKSREQKKRGFLIGISLLVLSLLPFALAQSRMAYEADTQSGIIMVKETVLRSAPDAESTEIITIHEGSKVFLLDVIGDWEKVRLVNGEQGWVKGDVIEEIEL